MNGIKKFACYCLYFVLPVAGNAQFKENFSDGDFSANPSWAGNTPDWIVNSALQLQSNNTTANSVFYLATASTLATTAQWEFLIDLKFSTSGTNYADVFLTASASDLTANSTSGYFVRIGNTTDEISLYRKDAGVIAPTKIIDGADGIVGSSTSNLFKIKVVRNAANQWSLYRDIGATANNYFLEGSASDATFSTSAFFGFLIKQSTVASFAQKHFFDDIEVKVYVPDLIPPVVQTLTAIAANAVDVLFSEPLDISSSQKLLNYTGSNSLGTPATVILDAVNNALVHLTFAAPFTSGFNYQLTISGIKDIAGNIIANITAGFTYLVPYTARQYDVVIDEIMADPSPVVSLPNNEWIELKNTSARSINLQGWRIGDASGVSGPMPGFTLRPDSFVIICSNSAVAVMSTFGPAIGVTSFPSLDNTADQLYLKSAQNTIIHAVAYKDSWYQNELKKDGGWSLEMIDTKNPCSGFTNWRASTDLRGGSPGKKNAVDAINVDKQVPALIRAFAIDSLNIVLVFDEALDSLKSATTTNFNINDGIGIPNVAIPAAPFFDRVALKLNAPLLRNKTYTVTSTGLTDCVGNGIANKNIARVGLSEIASAADIVINEILFNPPPAGTDYVEIYNRSKKIIDLKQTYIANRNSGGTISSITQLSADNYLLFPQDFMVITENAAAVKAGFIVQNTTAFTEVASLPSFNDDKGTVIILNAQGEVADELAYDEKWHFKLIDNKEGVALERIDYDAKTQLADNWHSAATAAGYGTPTYKNSQYRINAGLQGEIKLQPEIVSPDNDGQDDFATVSYQFPGPGYVANVTIFNAAGRPVRYLQRNALCGPKGTFTWDGLGEKNQALATGVYIFFTEVFDLKGNKRQFKNAIVLARR